ncbi:LysR substrate-binding domain-containing protein [Streptomyces sp. NPDC091280]|uniref:LysR substrate-binding domain-containing protein n=1 Tax=Streptomyces sp. NPDC091280 TaxID=3365984 RepID=UPI003804DDEF
MELRQVRYFLAVAEELHFGRAAGRLRVVQPTVSQQVRRLERELGLELFDRTTRNVTLTAAGHAFLPRARAIVAAEEAALETMVSLRADRLATLRVGTSTGLGTRLERLLADIEHHAPEITVELHSAPPAARLQQVRDGALDAAFVRGVGQSPGLDLIPVWRDELVVALPASHPLAARERVEIADLAAMPLRIAPHHANPHLVDLITSACRAAGFEPVMGPAFATDQDTLAAIGSSKPTWTVFYSSKAAILPTARTAFRPFAPPAPALQTYLAVRPTASARALAPLLDACRSQEA